MCICMCVYMCDLFHIELNNFLGLEILKFKKNDSKTDHLVCMRTVKEK